MFQQRGCVGHFCRPYESARWTSSRAFTISALALPQVRRRLVFLGRHQLAIGTGSDLTSAATPGVAARGCQVTPSSCEFGRGGACLAAGADSRWIGRVGVCRRPVPTKRPLWTEQARPRHRKGRCRALSAACGSAAECDTCVVCRPGTGPPLARHAHLRKCRGGSDWLCHAATEVEALTAKIRTASSGCASRAVLA